MWDTRTQRLYFVDIDARKVFTYEPSTGVYGFQLFDKKITALALRETRLGVGMNRLVATDEDGYVTITPESIPFPPTNGASPAPPERFPFDSPLTPSSATNRLNEAAVNPRGRFLAGTMGCRTGDFDGTLYVAECSNSHRVLIEGITCTNGMYWTDDATQCELNLTKR